MAVLAGRRTLLGAWLDGLDEGSLVRALIRFQNASDAKPATASGLLADWLRAKPEKWPIILAVGNQLGGTALAALALLVDEQPCVLPLDELSQQVSFQHIGLIGLGLQIDTRRIAQLRAQGAPEPVSELMARLLSDLSHRQSNAGDRDGALHSITEAVTHYRALTKANPAAFLPDLAMSLNNLSNRQSDAGDRDGALHSITEAVTHYRALAKANPAAFLPNLAGSLNNLSNQQSNAGDRDGALHSITEAVTIRRTLAKANPAAFLPDLARSLRLLTQIAKMLGLEEEGQTAWQTALTSFTNNATRAELRAYYALDLLHQGNVTDALIEITTAAQEATGEPGPVSRARQTIRTAAAQIKAQDTLLPPWAVAQIPDDHYALVMRWTNQRQWPETEVFLLEHRDMLTGTSFRTSLALLSELRLDVTGITNLINLLAAIDEHGFESVVSDFRSHAAAEQLLATWIDTERWDESAQFLAAHYAELAEPTALELLTQSDNPVHIQHAAILRLAISTQLDQVTMILTDPTAAINEAVHAIDSGDTRRFVLVLTAAPRLSAPPATHLLLDTVAALINSNQEEAQHCAQQIAETATDIERRAHAIHLRNYARATSDEVAHELAELIYPRS